MSSDTSEPVLLEKSSQDDTRPRMLSRQSTLTPKKCWICICDSTEDDPKNPPVWRSPCTCNLTAHESCLLDWVADLENPKKKNRNNDGKIQCPQCKSEIKITRPKSYVLDGIKAVEKTLDMAVLPGLGLSALGTLFAGCWVHGFQAVYVVFGHDHALKIFENANNHQRLAYAMIPLNLIFARTSFAGPVLTSGTFFLLSTQIDRHAFEIDMTLWPPLPSTVFICLPAIRRAYNWAYYKAFGELNRKWLEEVQPIATRDIEGEEAEFVEGDDQGGDAQIVFELEVNIGADEEEEGDQEAAPAPNVPMNPDQQGPAQNGNVQNNGNGNNANANPQVHHQVQEIVEGFSLSSTILGALVFPSVAAGMGQLLSYALPKSWMSNANMMRGRPGLLRDQWGRSVVGGAIFIVLKDALMLYSIWKRAQTHKQRRIVDYDKKAKKYLL